MNAQPNRTAALSAQARNFGADPWLGRTVADEFDVVELIGSGAQGRVYRALQRPFGRPVALKIFSGDAIANDEARIRAFREAQALGALTDPGIPRPVRFGHLVVDGALADGYFLALELVEGRSLRAVLDEEGRIEPLRALRIVREVLRVMAEMQRQGIAHRDIKPSHILLGRDGLGRERVTLIDFGIARREGGFAYEGRGEPLSEVGRLVGSPAYMAPEPMIDGSVTGPAGDQYSLGIVLFEMLTGHLPFDGDLQEVFAGHMMDDLPALPRDIDPDGRLHRLLCRATAKWVDERFADPATMDRAVVALVEARRAPSPAPAEPAPVAAEAPADESTDHGATVKLPDIALARPTLPLLSGHVRQVVAGVVIGVLAAAGSAAGAVLMTASM